MRDRVSILQTPDTSTKLELRLIFPKIGAWPDAEFLLAQG